MIESISIFTPTEKSAIPFDKSQKNKTKIAISNFLLAKINSFEIAIQFSQPIVAFRNHDYQWVKCNRDCIANEFCPKIIKLMDGTLVQANRGIGIWEINKKNKSLLLWRFNPENASPLTNYVLENNQRTINFANQNFETLECLALLFPYRNAIEFSRSKIPFTAIACFTDHCDFDTQENLALQRSFFKHNNIKITKGFFLNHFSKRKNNASFEHNAVELQLWKDDGHELCYHSLSQSIKSESESNTDFFNFIPPNSDMPTWIDHGYQPYNLSMFENKKIDEKKYETNLINKNIKILWNYIDSGTATFGVINQLNSQHFTLSNFLRGSKGMGLFKKTQLMIKNIVFHFYGDQKIVLKYKSIAGNFKNVFFQKDKSKFYPLVKNTLGIFFNILNVFLFWYSNKNKPYKLAKYTPILFKHTILEKEFYIFQTLEMVDFKKALCTDNIELLIKEKGVFIAHTYFSVPMVYHNGKLFDTVDTIDKEVSFNFSTLGTKIKNQEIWNPTLKELVGYWSGFEKIQLDIDDFGTIFVKNETDLIYRTIQ